ncbi:MAG: hypothetical protein K6C99_08400 [Lachnospiraceae bacterium]|nr:hypothetical protein [Lachnospiraceae bacterium]
MFDITLKSRKYLARVLTTVTAAGMIGSTMSGSVCYAGGYNAPTVSVNESLSDNEARTRIEIYTESDLAELAKNCHSDTWSEDKDVVLMSDISLSGDEFTNIPTFRGHFDGQGHTIRGYIYGGDGYVTGLFRYADEGAEIKDLTLMGSVYATGDEEVTGGIVGINRGLISGCKFVGRVEGKNVTGGIAAINEASGTLDNCENQAVVYGYYFTGGITGKNYGLINFCNNKGDVNSSSEWVTGDDEMNENIISDLTENGVKDVKVRSGIDTGGIAGYSKGILIRSSNDGTVGYPHTGYNVGGIAGRQSGIVTSCVNRGSVCGRKDVGGVVGQMEPFLQVDDTGSVSTSVDQLHDMIDDLLDDMDSGNATLGSDFDELKNIADSALDTSDELADNFEDYINSNTDTINKLGDRADDVTGMLPEVVDNVTDASKKADEVSDALGDMSDAVSGITDFSDKDKKLLEEAQGKIDEEKASSDRQSEIISANAADIDSILFNEDGTPRVPNSEERSRLADDMSAIAAAGIEQERSLMVISQQLADMEEIYKGYITDGAKDAASDAKTAKEKTDDALDSIQKAQNGVSDIVTYLNASEDLQMVGISRTIEEGEDTLKSQMDGMSDIMGRLADDAENYPTKVNDDIRKINDQLKHIYDLLEDRAEDINDGPGENFEDVSELAVLTATQGKVSYALNEGEVKGDINIGGIAGSMALDKDDPEENAAGSVDISLGGKYTSQNVLYYCTNYGYVSSKNDGAGGIVGFMKHGVASDCMSYGPVESTGGSYVGGICGQSLSVIRDCYVLCTLSGDNYIGGIAGYGSTISGCCSMPTVSAANGKCGAIAGQIEIDEDTEEPHLDTVTGNYYVSDSLYGIDEISYGGSAEPISYEELLARPECPSAFAHLTIRYYIDLDESEDESELYDLGSEDLSYGDALTDLHYPDIPVKTGYYGKWPEVGSGTVSGNLVLVAEYVKAVEVVESDGRESTSANRALVLVDDSFDDGAALDAEIVTEPAFYSEKGSFSEHVIYHVTLSGNSLSGSKEFRLRLLDPYGGKRRVFVYDGSKWQELELEERGGYLEVKMTGTEGYFCIAKESDYTVIYAVSAVVALIILIIAVKTGRKKKKKQAPIV